MTEIINYAQTLISTLISNYNGFLSTALNGNEFAIGMVITGSLGAVTYLLRAIPNKIYQTMKKHLTTTLTIDSSHAVYHEVMSEMVNQGVVDNSRVIKFSNGFNRWDNETNTKTISYGTQFFIWGHMPVKVHVGKHESDRQIIDIIEIRKFGRSHKFFDELLKSVQVKNESNKTDATDYYKQSGDDRSFINRQPHRDLDSIYIPTKQKNEIMHSIDTFHNNREFYNKHGIPYNLGILLHGEPGTGKSSLIKAIARYLKRDILLVKTSSEFVAASESNNVQDYLIVLEEVDTIGLAAREDTEQVDSVTGEPIEDVAEVVSQYSKMVLGNMLNSMDGLISPPGRIFVMTTNDKSKLDHALIRKGRIDLDVYVTFMVLESFSAMLHAFGHDMPDTDGYELSDSVRPSDVQTDLVEGMNTTDILKKYSKHNKKVKNEKLDKISKRYVVDHNNNVWVNPTIGARSELQNNTEPALRRS